MERLSNEVARELARFGPATAAMARIVEVWPGAVGMTIARNAWPARIGRDGTLHVATSSAAWAFELAQLEAEIVGRLRTAAGTASPRTLRFAVGKLPEQGSDKPAESERRRPPEPGVQELAAAAELTAGITDEELRKLVAKAAAQSLAATAADRAF